MSRIKAPANLPELVKSTFAKAKANGDLLFFPSQVAILAINSIPFQLRFSPSLASKPKPAKPQEPPSSAPQPKTCSTPSDPFDNPSPTLLIAHLSPPTHLLVLNKFAIVPEHFILATTTYSPQTHLLEPADLAATRACIDAYEQRQQPSTSGAGGGGKERRDEATVGEPRLFAFFNSGEHSGASQPHRHLQLLPVERMRDGLPAGPGLQDGVDDDGGGQGWDLLVDRLPSASDAGAEAAGEEAAAPPPPPRVVVPFPCFAERLGPTHSSDADPFGAALHATYLALYRRACGAVGVGISSPRGGGGGEGQEAEISYNLAMTRDTMALCPRRAEGAPLHAGADAVGSLALNGTVLAGTALVKNEAEWDALTGDPEQLGRVLAMI